MNVVQAMPPMTKYRPRAATIATYSQSGRPLGRRCSCICITPMSLDSSRQCAPTCATCDSSIATSATLTPCSQSHIGPVRHLRRQGTVPVEAAGALSVTVRWGPVRTAVNGTLLARPARTTFIEPGGWASVRPQGEVRPRGPPASLASGHRPAADGGWDSNPPLRRFTSRGPERQCPVTCDSCMSAVTARARRGPAVSDAVRTRYGPGPGDESRRTRRADLYSAGRPCGPAVGGIW